VSTYFSVTFDAGGNYGKLASGGSSVTYEIAFDASLSDAGIQAPPTVQSAAGYAFVGWAPQDKPLSYLSPTQVQQLLERPVTEPAVYVAVYAGIPSHPAQTKYYAVTFDAGGVYGTLAADSADSATLLVKAGTPLGAADGFSVPAVRVEDGSDLTFIGWSPDVDLLSPVNEVRTYTARYAYEPQGIAEIFHSVRFDLGAEGSFKFTPVTNYLVKEGTSLSAMPDSGSPAIFWAGYFAGSNIAVAQNFEFAGWSPAFDPDAPIYAPRVYRAQYAYVPPGFAQILYTALNVGMDPPDPESIQALGYEGYYDGTPHGIRYRLSADTLLSGVLSFRFGGSGDSAGKWIEGLPPDETDATRREIKLMFAANGKIPREVARSIVIRPRPVVPSITHADIGADDDAPLRASYDLAVLYDGLKQDGTPIGDAFDFAAFGNEAGQHKREIPIATTYQKGDPAGAYPIYAKAGVYGNFEIYEGAGGAWPFFAGWRFAGVLHVTAPSVDDGIPKQENPGGGPPATGDGAHTAIWIGLLLLSGGAGAALIRMRLRAGKRAAV
jgi:hypothetical protein